MSVRGAGLRSEKAQACIERSEAWLAEAPSAPLGPAADLKFHQARRLIRVWIARQLGHAVRVLPQFHDRNAFGAKRVRLGLSFLLTGRFDPLAPLYLADVAEKVGTIYRHQARPP